MYKSIYATNSPIAREGHGGAVVGFHELEALTDMSAPQQIFQRIGKLFYEDAYPDNPFMYDYFIASLLKEPEQIDMAHFYGSNFSITSKRLSKAKKFATIPAHNLDISLQEWTTEFTKYWSPPPPHLTDANLFAFMCQWLTEVKVICPSTVSAKFLKERLGINATIIPHGTDIPPTVDFNRQQFNVLHISQFGPDKGQIYLLKAWEKFATPDKPVTMTLCSNVAESLTQNKHGLKVVFGIPEQQKTELYNKASVYVQPSVTEGFGLTVLEAMAHGTPVIVSEGAGVKDIITDGQEGFIVPIRNPDAIVEKLQFMYNYPQEAMRMGYNARITAEKYSWDKIEARYVQLWNQ